MRLPGLVVLARPVEGQLVEGQLVEGQLVEDRPVLARLRVPVDLRLAVVRQLSQLLGPFEEPSARLVLLDLKDP